MPDVPPSTILRPQSPNWHDEKQGKSKLRLSLVTALSIGIFIVASLLTGGMYGVELLEKDKKAKLEDNLKTFEDNLNIDNVRGIAELDKKVDIANSLLDNHTNSRLLLEAVQQVTLKSVYFENLSYDPVTDHVVIRVVAPDDLPFAEQLQIFESNENFRNLLFSDIVTSANSKEVKFTVEFDFR